MSRYVDHMDDPEIENQYELWRANVRRAIKGKRGRKTLAELREAVLALPEKRLIAGALCTVRPEVRADDVEYARSALAEVVSEEGEGVCLIGAYLWHKKVKAGADPDSAFAELPAHVNDFDTYDGLRDTADAAKAAGMAGCLAWDLAYRNDEYRYASPEARYSELLAWIDKELGTASTPAGRDAL